VPKFSSPNHFAKFASEACSGRSFGGLARISLWVFNEPSAIHRNGKIQKTPITARTQ